MSAVSKVSIPLFIFLLFVTFSAAANSTTGLNLYLFIATIFIFTYFVGHFLEKFRVPWIFAALVFGALLAFSNPFRSETSSDTFIFLAQLGMYFLLFIIGFEINLREMRKRSGFLIKSTIFVILLECIMSALLIHFIFGYDLLISIVVALSFATVGEAFLLPILHEFKLVNTSLGQTILGIGTLDDLFEIITLIFAVFLVGSGLHESINIVTITASLAVLFLMAYGLTKLGKSGRQFDFANLETLFLFAIFVLFLFLGIGQYADTTALAALMAGAAIGNFLPKQRKELLDEQIKAVCYGFFAPVFFVWVGSTINIEYLLAFPLFIVLITLVAKFSKILGSYIVARHDFGTKQSIVMGIALSVRFSTGIIIVKMLYENGIIESGLYSVIIASTIVFKFLVPLLLSYLIPVWGINGKSAR